MVALTETWLTSTKYSSDLFGNQYHVSQKNRGNSEGETLLVLRADILHMKSIRTSWDTAGEDWRIKFTG